MGFSMRTSWDVRQRTCLGGNVNSMAWPNKLTDFRITISIYYEVYCYGTDEVITKRMIRIDDPYAKAHSTLIPKILCAKLLRRIG